MNNLVSVHVFYCLQKLHAYVLNIWKLRQFQPSGIFNILSHGMDIDDPSMSRSVLQPVFLCTYGYVCVHLAVLGAFASMCSSFNQDTEQSHRGLAQLKNLRNAIEGFAPKKKST